MKAAIISDMNSLRKYEARRITRQRRSDNEVGDDIDLCSDISPRLKARKGLAGISPEAKEMWRSAAADGRGP